MIIGIASADRQPPNKSIDRKEHWGGSGWARVGQYMSLFREAGHFVVSGTLYGSDTHLLIQEEITKEFHAPDIVIIQRLMLEGVDKSILNGRKQGQIVLNDVDDWYWGLDQRNSAWKASHPKYSPKENVNFYSKNVRASDAVIVSTPFLADKVKEKFNVPTILLPNFVDTQRFSQVKQNEHPTFGWVGSTAHRSGDIEVMRGLFDRFLNEGSLSLHHSGHIESSPLFSDSLRLPADKVSTSPAAPVEFYPSMMTFDVGLVPLNDVPFNHAKSEIKGLEYASAGIPFIASDLPSYRRVYGDWDGGFFLAKRPKDWLKAISSLLDVGLRMELQSALLEKVKTRDISVGARLYLDILEGFK